MIRKIFVGMMIVFCLSSFVLAAPPAPAGNKVAKQPCLNPIDTVDWDFFTDDIIFGSYGSDGSSEANQSYFDPNNPAYKPGATPKDDGTMCECISHSGDAVAGFRMRMSEPIGFIEVVDRPKSFPCFQNTKQSSKGGIVKQTKWGNGSTQSASSQSDKGGGYRNAHFITYPVFATLNILMDKVCGSKGSIGLPFIGELEPEWYSDFIAVILHPLSLLFNNPIAQIACAYDCVKSTIDSPVNLMTWCTGCWGGIKNKSGRVDGANEIVEAAVLATRAISQMHRTLRLKQTIPFDTSVLPFVTMNAQSGTDIVCSPPYFPEIIKSQYFLNLSYPLAGNAFAIGEWPMEWENFKRIPAYPAKIFTVWRRKACCFNVTLGLEG